MIRIPPTARVPQAPKALIGVANLRGVVLPIASLHALLGLEVEESPDSRAIVLDGGAPVAIVVDAIDALAAPIHRQRCFSEILVRGDFGCGSSFGFFTA